MIIDKAGPDGNAFFIMARVRELMIGAGRKDELPEINKRMTSGDYDNLCRVAEEVSFGSLEFIDSRDDGDDDD